MSKHSPTPWTIRRIKRHLMSDDYAQIIDRDGAIVANSLSEPGSDDNAAHIIRAVNSHVDLVDACEQFVASMKHAEQNRCGSAAYWSGPAVRAAQRAIAAAKK